MKLIIDIPDEIYQEAIKSGYSYQYDELVANAVAEGTPIPKSATNGDVMEIMFSKVNFYVGDWWDKPYQKCGSYNNTNTFKSCCDCKLIGTDSCYMVCGGSKSLYKPRKAVRNEKDK